MGNNLYTAAMIVLDARNLAASAQLVAVGAGDNPLLACAREGK
jgi:hypothetical protein